MILFGIRVINIQLKKPFSLKGFFITHCLSLIPHELLSLIQQSTIFFFLLIQHVWSFFRQFVLGWNFIIHRNSETSAVDLIRHDDIRSFFHRTEREFLTVENIIRKNRNFQTVLHEFFA